MTAPDRKGPEGGREGEEAIGRMPPVWAGRRRRLLVCLAVLGGLQAVLALMMAMTVNALLSPNPSWDGWDLMALGTSVLGIGLARWIERVVAEELGQDYVFEQRRRLMTSALGSTNPAGSLGVTVTRASNDLTAVRNWVALGLVPLVTAVPLILVILLGLAVIDWRVAAVVSAPLLLVVAAVPVLASQTLRRSRELRRRRGRMSARIADSVLAGESVRVSGAVHRELKAVDRDSGKVVTAAVDRAWITGLTRALTVTAASLCTVAVVVLAVLGHADPAGVASVMTLLGVMSTPVTDFGRVVEYRQNYRAAARILVPLMAEADAITARERRRRAEFRRTDVGPSVATGPGEVTVRGLVVDGRRLPDLHAAPGDRILLSSADPAKVRAAVRELFGTGTAGVLGIDGRDYAGTPARARRGLVGLASGHIPLERGSVSRLVSYRVPDASNVEIRQVLNEVGLRETVRAAGRGLSLKLKNGGSPWSGGEVTRLKLARALLRRPPLLVLEGVDSLLGAEGIDLLRRIIDNYPGVVFFSSHRPELLAENFIAWDVGGEAPAGATRSRSGGDPGVEEDE